MFGCGRGWNRWGPGITPPSGHAYIGPCRCGRGPHAYYRDENGSIVHAWQLHGRSAETISRDDRRAELEALREEKMRLERRVQEMEAQVKGKK